MNAVVLGMHRSGTSALARLLVQMGGEVGSESEVMPGKEDNPLGFFERLDVYALHEKVFERLGRHWSSVASVPLEELTAAEREEAAQTVGEILSRFGPPAGFRVLKDPRLNHMLPLWSPVLEPCSFLLIVRHPRAVADSLHRRNGFSRIHALALWESYNRAAAVHLRERAVLVVDFDLLVNEPRAQAERVRRHLEQTLELKAGIKAESGAESAIESSLRHQEERSLEPGGPASTEELWNELERASRNPDAVALRRTALSRWAGEVLTLQQDLARGESEAALRIARLEELLAAESIRYAELFDRRTSELATLQGLNDELSEKLHEMEATASKVSAAEVEQARAHIAHLESTIEDLGAQAARQEARVKDAESELAGARRELSVQHEQKKAALEQTKAAREQTRAAREQAEAAREQQKSREEERRRELAIERARAAALELDVEATKGRLLEVEWVLQRYESSRSVRWAKRLNRVLGRE